MKTYNQAWKLALIAILALLFSLTFRLDLDNYYPKGADTYELYGLSKDVQEKGHVVWNIDFPTSIGMTSISYPSGGIIFISEISLITGLDLTSSTIIFNVFLILMAGMLLYIISKDIFSNEIISILTVLIYLNTRFFISYSTFFTSRNILQLFFLVILFLLIKNIHLDIKKTFLILTLIGVSFLTHRSTIILLLFLFAFILSKIANKFYKNKMSYNLAILLFGIAIFLSAAYFFGHTNIGSETTRISFNTGITYIDDILSIIFSISMHFGILIILLPIGYFVLLLKKEKNYKDMFVLTGATLALAFMVETIYFFYLFLPLMTILIAYFLQHILKMDKRNIKYSLVAIIIMALIIPVYITIRESKSDILIVREQTVELIDFLDNNMIEKNVICNNHIIYCSHISSLSKNVNALTSSSGRTMIDKIIITESETNIMNVRSKIFYKENIIGVSLFSDTYTSAIINWNTPKPVLDTLLEFTNVGYLIDSNNADSVSNRARIESKFGDMDRIYDNGLQQVKVIE